MSPTEAEHEVLTVFGNQCRWMVEGRADLLDGILHDSFTATHITGYVPESRSGPAGRCPARRRLMIAHVRGTGLPTGQPLVTWGGMGSLLGVLDCGLRECEHHERRDQVERGGDDQDNAQRVTVVGQHRCSGG